MFDIQNSGSICQDTMESWEMDEYAVDVGGRRLGLGHRREIAWSEPRVSGTGPCWNSFGDGDVLTARTFVRAAGGLLTGVCERVGEPADVEGLVECLSAVLRTTGRESALPLGTLGYDGRDGYATANAEIARQAAAIGEWIVQWAAEAARESAAETTGGPRTERLAVRSRCEGHLWTPRAAALLTGESGSPEAMELFNEWLHQLVLLRDAMLPFTGWESVPFPVAPDGLRRLTSARQSLLAEILTRRVRHTAVVAFAQEVVTGTRGPAGYGFQDGRGLVLPAVIGGSPLEAPRSLLAWHPARVALGSPDAGGDVTTFGYADADHGETPRVTVPSGSRRDDQDEGGPGVSARVIPTRTGDGLTRLGLELRDGTRRSVADLGQVLRGHRYSYRAVPAAGDDAPPGDAEEHSARRLDAWALLDAPGLVTAPDGVNLVATGGDPLVALALLGRIHPENVILRHGEEWPAVLAAGKAGPARFVIDLTP
jgi:hypothetical protein